MVEGEKEKITYYVVKGRLRVEALQQLLQDGATSGGATTIGHVKVLMYDQISSTEFNSNTISSLLFDRRKLGAHLVVPTLRDTTVEVMSHYRGFTEKSGRANFGYFPNKGTPLWTEFKQYLVEGGPRPTTTWKGNIEGGGVETGAERFWLTVMNFMVNALKKTKELVYQYEMCMLEGMATRNETSLCGGQAPNPIWEVITKECVGSHVFQNAQEDMQCTMIDHLVATVVLASCSELPPQWSKYTKGTHRGRYPVNLLKAISTGEITPDLWPPNSICRNGMQEAHALVTARLGTSDPVSLKVENENTGDGGEDNVEQQPDEEYGGAGWGAEPATGGAATGAGGGAESATGGAATAPTSTNQLQEVENENTGDGGEDDVEPQPDEENGGTGGGAEPATGGAATAPTSTNQLQEVENENTGDGGEDNVEPQPDEENGGAGGGAEPATGGAATGAGGRAEPATGGRDGGRTWDSIFRNCAIHRHNANWDDLLTGEGGGAINVTPASTASYIKFVVGAYSPDELRERVVMVRIGCAGASEALSIAANVEVALTIVVEAQPNSINSARKRLNAHRAEMKSPVIFVMANVMDLNAQCFEELAANGGVADPIFALYSIAVPDRAFVSHVHRVVGALGKGTSLAMWEASMWKQVSDQHGDECWDGKVSFPTYLSRGNYEQREMTCRKYIAPKKPQHEAPGQQGPWGGAKMTVRLGQQCPGRVHYWMLHDDHARCYNEQRTCVTVEVGRPLLGGVITPPGVTRSSTLGQEPLPPGTSS